MILNNNHFAISGATLVELLVTLLILTIGIVALTRFQGADFHYAALSKQRTEAVELAKTKLDSLRSFEVINTTTGKTAYNDISSGSSTSTVNNTSYTTTWTVTTNTSPDYKTVNVTVSWTDRRGATQSVSLSSIISKTDPATSGVLVYG